MHWWMSNCHSREKAKQPKTSSKKTQSTLSKAFSMSSWIATRPPLPCFLFKVCLISWTRMKFSWIYMLGTKAFWEGEMSLGSRAFNRVERILEIILYDTLHKLIGQKWDANEGWSCLGMIEVLEQIPRVEKFVNHYYHFSFDKRPIFFKENSWKTIEARRFSRT